MKVALSTHRPHVGGARTISGELVRSTAELNPMLGVLADLAVRGGPGLAARAVERRPGSRPGLPASFARAISV
jgi:hypothetical protein